jgi:cell division transport system permease protein
MVGMKNILLPDRYVNQVVPTNGFTTLLTFFTSASMAFLIVFSVAISFAADRLAHSWSGSLANSATLRVSAPKADLESQTQAALNVLSNTKGIASFRLLKEEEQQALLEPWFGPKVPINNLPMPRLISIEEDENGYDRAGLRLRLAAEVPSAVLDDHTRWRQPLIKAAYRIWFLGWLSIGLIFFIVIAMMVLVTRAALSSNRKVIEVLRLVGATDQYIAAAFVRKFAFRAFFGSALGAMLASITLFLLPSEVDQTAVLLGLRLEGLEWSWLIVVPLSFFVMTFLTARISSLSILKSLA